jgi:hypothetical protein
MAFITIALYVELSVALLLFKCYAECHYVECHNAECRGTLKFTVWPLNGRGKKVLLKLPPVRDHRRAPATGRPEQEQRTEKLLLRHLREGGDGQPVAQESLRQHQGPGDPRYTT